MYTILFVHTVEECCVHRTAVCNESQPMNEQHDDLMCGGVLVRELEERHNVVPAESFTSLMLSGYMTPPKNN